MVEKCLGSVLGKSSSLKLRRRRTIETGLPGSAHAKPPNKNPAATVIQAKRDEEHIRESTVKVSWRSALSGSSIRKLKPLNPKPNPKP